MKTSRKPAFASLRRGRQDLLVAALVGALVGTTASAQPADSPYKFERGYPVAGTAERAYDAMDLRRAVEAYKFFYPTIGTEAVMQQMLAAGAKVNEVGIVMATGPRQQFGGANADTPYAIATVESEQTTQPPKENDHENHTKQTESKKYKTVKATRRQNQFARG